MKHGEDEWLLWGSILLLGVAVGIVIGGYLGWNGALEANAATPSIHDREVEVEEVVPVRATLHVDASALLPGTVVKLDKPFVLHVPIFDQCMLTAIDGYDLAGVPVEVSHDYRMSKLTIVCSYRPKGAGATVTAVDK